MDIPEPIKHTKLVFSDTLLSFCRGSGCDQLLYGITELPASFLRPVPRFESCAERFQMQHDARLVYSYTENDVI